MQELYDEVGGDETNQNYIDAQIKFYRKKAEVDVLT